MLTEMVGLGKVFQELEIDLRKRKLQRVSRSDWHFKNY